LPRDLVSWQGFLDGILNILKIRLSFATLAVPVSKAVVLETGDDVDVGVEDELAGGFLIIDDHIDAVSFGPIFNCWGYFFDDWANLRSGCLGSVENINKMNLRDD